MMDILGTCIDLGIKLKDTFEQIDQNRDDRARLSADIVDLLSQISETLRNQTLPLPDELHDNVSLFENELRGIFTRQQALQARGNNGRFMILKAKVKEIYHMDDTKNQLIELRQKIQTCGQKLHLSIAIRTEGRVANINDHVTAIRHEHEAIMIRLDSLIPSSNPARIATLGRIQERTQDQLSILESDGLTQHGYAGTMTPSMSHSNAVPSLKSSRFSLTTTRSALQKRFLKRKLEELGEILPQARKQGSKASTLGRLNPFRDVAVWECSYTSKLNQADSLHETLRILKALQSNKMGDIEIAKELILLAKLLGDSELWEEAGIMYDWGIQICCEITKTSGPKITSSLASFVHKVFSDIALLGKPEDAQRIAQQETELCRKLRDQEQKLELVKLVRSWGKTFYELTASGRAGVSIVAGHQVVEIHRFIVTMDREAFLPDLAFSLHELAAELAKVGRHKEAAEMVKQAVMIRKELLAQDPKTYLPGMVESLHTLVAESKSIGEYEDAMSTVQECIELLQKSGEKDRQNHFPSLISSLQNLITDSSAAREVRSRRIGEEVIGVLPPMIQEGSNSKLSDPSQFSHMPGVNPGDAQRDSNPLKPKEEDVQTDHEAVNNPNTHLVDLRESPHSFTGGLFETGQKRTMVNSGQEFHRMHPDLEKRYPERRIRELSKSLIRLADNLSDNEQYDDSIKAYKEAVEMYRNLVDRDRQTYLPPLSRSLHQLGWNLGEVNRDSEAVEVEEEAITMRRELVERDRQTYLPDLCLSLNNLGVHLGTAGRSCETLEVWEEVLKLQRELVKQDRQTYLPDLALSMQNFSISLAKAGRLDDAAGVMEEVISMCRELVEQDRQTYISKLCDSLDDFTAMLSDMGRPGYAVKVAQEVVKLRLELTTIDPDTNIPE